MRPPKPPSNPATPLLEPHRGSSRLAAAVAGPRRRATGRVDDQATWRVRQSPLGAIGDIVWSYWLGPEARATTSTAASGDAAPLAPSPAHRSRSGCRVPLEGEQLPGRRSRAGSSRIPTRSTSSTRMSGRLCRGAVTPAVPLAHIGNRQFRAALHRYDGSVQVGPHENCDIVP